MAERQIAPTAPPLALETDAGSTVLSPGREYHLGRDPSSDVVLDDDRVSWHHAVLRAEAGHWTRADERSTNGTYTDGHRVHEWEVGPGSVVRFGSPADGPRALFTGRETVPERPSGVLSPGSTGTFRRPTTVRPLPRRTVRIGRAADNDLVVDDLVVSRHHAELAALPDGTYEITDLGSQQRHLPQRQPRRPRPDHRR